MSVRFILAMAAGAVLAASSPASAAFTINFGTVIGDGNPLSINTSDGTNVSFDSPSGANTFSVESVAGLFQGFSAGLGDFLSFSGDTLTITFSKPLASGLSFPFGIEDAFSAGGDILTITPNVGSVVNAVTSLDSLSFPEPEGNAFINAPGATELTITSATPFAIGNINVPEPFSLSIFGMGLAGLMTARRRRS